MEIAARWAALPAIYDGGDAPRSRPSSTRSSRRRTSRTPTPTVRASTSPSPASRRPDGTRRVSTAAAWDAGTRAVLAHGGALSHHHGVGLNRARFVREALGPAFDVLAAAKPRSTRTASSTRASSASRARSARAPPGPERGDRFARTRARRRRRDVVGARRGRRRRRTRRRRASSAAAPRLTRARTRRVRRDRDERRRARARPSCARRRRARRRGRHRQPARVDRRVGPNDRRADRPRHRLAGPPHGRAVPRAACAGLDLRAEPERDEGRGDPRRRAIRSGRATWLRHGRHAGWHGSSPRVRCT